MHADTMITKGTNIVANVLGSEGACTESPLALEWQAFTQQVSSVIESYPNLLGIVSTVLTIVITVGVIMKIARNLKIKNLEANQKAIIEAVGKLPASVEKESGKRKDLERELLQKMESVRSQNLIDDEYVKIIHSVTGDDGIELTPEVRSQIMEIFIPHLIARAELMAEESEEKILRLMDERVIEVAVGEKLTPETSKAVSDLLPELAVKRLQDRAETDWDDLPDQMQKFYDMAYDCVAEFGKEAGEDRDLIMAGLRELLPALAVDRVKIRNSESWEGLYSKMKDYYLTVWALVGDFAKEPGQDRELVLEAMRNLLPKVAVQRIARIVGRNGTDKMNPNGVAYVQRVWALLGELAAESGPETKEAIRSGMNGSVEKLVVKWLENPGEAPVSMEPVLNNLRHQIVSAGSELTQDTGAKIRSFLESYILTQLHAGEFEDQLGQAGERLVSSYLKNSDIPDGVLQVVIHLLENVSNAVAEEMEDSGDLDSVKEVVQAHLERIVADELADPESSLRKALGTKLTRIASDAMN